MTITKPDPSRALIDLDTYASYLTDEQCAALILMARQARLRAEAPSSDQECLDIIVEPGWHLVDIGTTAASEDAYLRACEARARARRADG